MSENRQIDELQAHKVFSGDLYNLAWELLDKGKERTELEDEEMLFASYGSAYHWHKLKGAIDEDRWKQSRPIAHDQLSRVNVELGNYEMALYHASRALYWCEKSGIRDLWLAFAYERLAVANHHLGLISERDKYLKAAEEAAKGIIIEQDRNYYMGELAKDPGYVGT